jgi:hypothetical protein
MLHYQIQQPAIAELAPSHLKESKQMWMREFCRDCPSRKLAFGVVRVGRNQLDSGFLRILPATLCEKHGAVIGATEILAQVEFAIDDFAFPLFPELDHFSRLNAHRFQRYCMRVTAHCVEVSSTWILPPQKP